MKPEVEHPSVKCQGRGCNNESRMAVSTKRPTRGRMYSIVDYDDRTAPKGSMRYCFACGLDTVENMIRTFVSSDTPFIEPKRTGKCPSCRHDWGDVEWFSPHGDRYAGCKTCGHCA